MSFSENFLVLPPANSMMFLQKLRRSNLSELRFSEVSDFNSSNQQNQKNDFQATEKPTLHRPVILSKKYVIPQKTNNTSGMFYQIRYQKNYRNSHPQLRD